MPDYILGPLPWSEDILCRALSLSIRETYEAIKEHPGYEAHHDLCNLQLSLEIFLDSVSDLLRSIQNFHSEAESPKFWYRSSLNRFNSLELSVRRGVFSAAASALSLVTNTRIIQGKVKIPEYDRRREEYFDEEEHQFIQALRNYVSHVRMIEVDWQGSISYSEERKETRFLIQRDKLAKLLDWKELRTQARDFINRHPKGIDVKKLFESYQSRVEKFQEWFQIEIARASEPQLSEYRGYELQLKRIASKSSWNLLLEIVIQGHRDPMAYLDRELTKEELEEVLALPMRSPEQIDRIIEILDEYGACDEELKRKIYTAFGLEI